MAVEPSFRAQHLAKVGVQEEEKPSVNAGVLIGGARVASEHIQARHSTVPPKDPGHCALNTGHSSSHRVCSLLEESFTPYSTPSWNPFWKCFRIQPSGVLAELGSLPFLYQ